VICPDSEAPGLAVRARSRTVRLDRRPGIPTVDLARRRRSRHHSGLL